MPRIEELPDDFTDTLHISSSSNPSHNGTTTSTTSTSSRAPPNPTRKTTTTTPPLPPNLTTLSPPTADRPLSDFLSDLNRHPLFMTTLDETDGKGGVNVELEGLKALAYEGTPEEVAGNFKEQGNEQFAMKRWKDAREFYDRGVAMLVDTRRKVEKKKKETMSTPEETDEDRELINGKAELPGMDYQKGDPSTQRKLEETLYINRAACNLELANYRMVTRDCLAALALNPSNIKAHYRLAQALYSLSKTGDATEAVHHGLALSPSNPALLKLQSKIHERGAALATKARETQQREERVRAETQTLRAALRSRGILVRTTNSPPPLPPSSQTAGPAQITLAEPLNPTSTLFLPTLILYPLASQTDFIAALPADTSLSVHLAYILPPPWNDDPDIGKGEYRDLGAVECFMRTKTGGLAKVGKKVLVEKVLDSRGPDGTEKKTKEEGPVFEVLDGVLQVIVVPKGRVAEWVEEYKRKVGKAL